MPPSNVEIHRLAWFAVVAIFALLPFGRIFGFACLPITLPARALRHTALRRHRARRVDSGLHSEPN